MDEQREERAERQSRPPDPRADLRMQTVAQLLIATVLVGAALFWLKSVMIPFVLAIFLALALAPVADQLMWMLRLPKGLAIFVTFLLSMGLLLLSMNVVTGTVTELAANAANYQERLGLLLSRLIDRIPFEAIGLSPEDFSQPLRSIPMTTVSGVLVGTTNAILDLLSQAMLVTVFLIFLLVALTGRERDRPASIWAEMESRVTGFIFTKALISAGTGVLVGLTLEFLGVDLALAFGFFAFLLNFIPTFGSIASTLLPLPIVLMDPQLSTFSAILAIGLPGFFQFLIGNVVEPLVLGESLELNPVAILLSLLIWGALWGVVGMLLATPIMAVIKILTEQSPTTRPFARLLGSRAGPA